MIVNDEGLKCHDIFSHKIDNNIFTELHIEIAGTNDFNTAHDIVSRIEKKIKEQIDIITSVKIHIDEPSELTYETRDITENSKEMIRNINNIIGNYRQVEDFKNIKIISSNDKIRVSLDCEFDAGMSLEKVHDIVTSIESNLYLHLKELYTNLSNVIVHAEPKSKN
jgi:divalent metal cation (Fe/Co/Zn/Cd) transporter